MISHHRSYGTLTTVPPSRAIASSFVCGACSGAMIVAGTPSSRAAQATPCAMLPALAVTTPLAVSARERLPDRVDGAADLERADRLQVLELEPDLRRPVDRRGAGAASGSRRRRSSRGRARSRRAGSELDLGADALLAGLAHDQLGGGEVLDREAERLEDGQLVRVACGPGCAPISTSPSSARMCSSPSPASSRSPDSFRVDSRRSTKRPAAAIVSVSSSRAVGRLAPTAFTWVPGASQSRCRIGSRALVQVQTTSAPRERPSSAVAAVAAAPRADLGVAEDGAHRLGVRARLDAGAEDRDDPRVWPRERTGRHRRDSGGADLGDRRGVQERAQLARSRRRGAARRPGAHRARAPGSRARSRSPSATRPSPRRRGAPA